MTRSEENPTIAPGSARMMSARFAKLPYACPVAGLASTVISGIPAWLSRLAATVVLAICIRDSAPSWMRVPPLVMMATVGRPIFVARSSVSAIFSPTAHPIVPPMKPKSRTISITRVPAIEAVPVSAASVSPVLCWSWKMRLL